MKVKTIQEWLGRVQAPFSSHHRLVYAHQGDMAVIVPVPLGDDGIDLDVYRLCPWFVNSGMCYDDLFHMGENIYLHRFTGKRFQKLSTHFVRIN